MRIGIDTFGCDHGRSGTGSYLFSLIKSLPENSSDKIELFGFELDRFVFDSAKSAITFEGLHIPDSVFSERAWHFLFLNKFIKKQKYDAVLFPAAMVNFPVITRSASIIIVDELFSDVLHRTQNVFLRWQLKRCLRKAKKIIAVSRFIKKELTAFGVRSDKIEVVYDGVDHSLFYPRPNYSDEVVLIQPFAIKRPFIIYPSRIQYPEKKHIELIKAYSLFKQRTGLPHKLVIAGAEGSNADVVLKAVLACPYASDIVLTGYFPHQTLPDLYAIADACVIPSVNEGFGLPVLEAMSCGIPVVCAKSGALPEIAGNGALYCNPDDIEETAAVIEKIITDVPLRKKCISENTEWVSRFSWEKTSARTLEIIKNAALE